MLLDYFKNTSLHENIILTRSERKNKINSIYPKPVVPTVHTFGVVSDIFSQFFLKFAVATKHVASALSVMNQLIWFASSWLPGLWSVPSFICYLCLQKLI